MVFTGKDGRPACLPGYIGIMGNDAFQPKKFRTKFTMSLAVSLIVVGKPDLPKNFAFVSDTLPLSPAFAADFDVSFILLVR